MSVVLSPGAGVDLSANAAAPLASWAEPLQRRGWYEARGRGPLGFDCLGVALWVQGFLGRRVRDYADCYRELDITRTADIDELFRAESDCWGNVAVGGVGDVLVLGRAYAHHLAVLCGAGHALDVTPGIGVRVSAIEGRRNVARVAGLKVFACVRPR